MRALGSTRARTTGAGNLVWGALLLLTGDLLWRDLTGRAATPAERGAVTVLGSRHALQGLIQLLAPAGAPRLWALVDLSHATSMVALAAVDPDRRRPALVSAGASLGSALGSAAAVRQARRRAAAQRMLRSTTRARRASRDGTSPGAGQPPASRAGPGAGASGSQVVTNRPKPPDMR